VASEAKMLWPYLEAFHINRIALSDAVNFRWVLGEDTLIDGVRQVLPGERITLMSSGTPARARPRVPVFAPDESLTLKAATEQTDVALRHSLERASGE
jgi:hypothetical protein